jgi:hypothetical protein
MELGEKNAARCEGVDIRRIDVAAVRTQIRVPEIIGDDQHDIRLRGHPRYVCSVVRSITSGGATQTKQQDASQPYRDSSAGEHHFAADDFR